MKRLELQDHDRVQVVGITGSGKSHWTKEHIVTPAPRVIVWDPKDEYAAERDTGVRGVRAVSIAELADCIDDRDLRVAVVPDWNTPAECAREFEVFAGLVKLAARDLVLVVDEVALLAGAAGSVTMLAVLSRAWGVPLVLVAQRAVSIPKTAREQVSKLISFRQSSPDDIAALAERIGAKAEKVAKLPRYEFVAWDEAESFE